MSIIHVTRQRVAALQVHATTDDQYWRQSSDHWHALNGQRRQRNDVSSNVVTPFLRLWKNVSVPRNQWNSYIGRFINVKLSFRSQLCTSNQLSCTECCSLVNEMYLYDSLRVGQLRVSLSCCLFELMRPKLNGTVSMAMPC